MGRVLDYNLPYHVIQEEEEDTYRPKLSFKNYEDAIEFIKFAHTPDLIVVKTQDLKKFYLGLEYKKSEF